MKNIFKIGDKVRVKKFIPNKLYGVSVNPIMVEESILISYSIILFLHQCVRDDFAMIMQRANFIPEDTHTEMTLTASLPAIETYLIFNLGSGILHSTHALVHKCS